MESVPQRVEFDFETAGSHEEDVAVEQCTAGHRHMLARTRAGQLYLFGMRTWIKPVRVRGDDDSFSTLSGGGRGGWEELECGGGRGGQRVELGEWGERRAWDMAIRGM